MSVSAFFVQYMLKNRSVSDKKFRDLVYQVSPNDSQLNPKLILEEIKSKLDAFNLSIEYIKCELTGSKYYVCLPSVERECFAEFPLLSKNEEDCMFALIDEIMNTSGIPIGSNDAINIFMGLGQTEMIRPDKAIEILRSFVSKNILVENEDGCYILGPLVLSSLKLYLASHASAKVCSLCNKDVVYNKHCLLCDASMHVYCYKNAQLEENVIRCPVCQR